jgi:hypothetical protein
MSVRETKIFACAAILAVWETLETGAIGWMSSKLNQSTIKPRARRYGIHMDITVVILQKPTKMQFEAS